MESKSCYCWFLGILALVLLGCCCCMRAKLRKLCCEKENSCSCGCEDENVNEKEEVAALGRESRPKENE